MTDNRTGIMSDNAKQTFEVIEKETGRNKKVISSSKKGFHYISAYFDVCGMAT